jgi:hypothetical protein
MHSLQVRDAGTHLPTAAQPFARRELPTDFRLVGRSNFRHLHWSGCGLLVLLNGCHACKLLDFYLRLKPNDALASGERCGAVLILLSADYAELKI